MSRRRRDTRTSTEKEVPGFVFALGELWPVLEVEVMMRQDMAEFDLLREAYPLHWSKDPTYNLRRPRRG